MSLSEVEELRRQLRALEAYFVEYRKRAENEVSTIASWALGVQQSINAMRGTLEEIANRGTHEEP